MHCDAQKLLVINADGLGHTSSWRKREDRPHRGNRDKRTQRWGPLRLRRIAKADLVASYDKRDDRVSKVVRVSALEILNGSGLLAELQLVGLVGIDETVGQERAEGQ